MPEAHVINRPNIPTVALPAPTHLLPGGRGPVVHATPAVANGPIGEAVLTELTKRATTPADDRRKGAKP